MDVKKEPFGKTKDGQRVDMYSLANANDMRAKVMTYGAILVSLEVPDRQGNPGEVTLGFDSLDGYLKGHPYFGAIVGRYANRFGKRPTTDRTICTAGWWDSTKSSGMRNSWNRRMAWQ